ncbi:SSI family serine proteinase inhibitor [Microtetraspora malaysiensis]|uniref:SSI family serine proteinase inhibitor n=1 Tax=Microtetraspora malaysiensis TaxID=161358 RepID=UPI003D8FFDED
MRPLLALLAFTTVAISPAGAAVAATVPPPWGPDANADVPVTRVHPMKPRTKALVVTVAKGQAGTPPQRYALLNCSFTRGTHPAPSRVCPTLERVGGDPAKLQPDPAVACPMIFDPVTVTAYGIWNDAYIRFERTYGNSCQLRATTGAIFAF